MSERQTLADQLFAHGIGKSIYYQRKQRGMNHHQALLGDATAHVAVTYDARRKYAKARDYCYQFKLLLTSDELPTETQFTWLMSKGVHPVIAMLTRDRMVEDARLSLFRLTSDTTGESLEKKVVTTPVYLALKPKLNQVSGILSLPQYAVADMRLNRLRFL